MKLCLGKHREFAKHNNHNHKWKTFGELVYQIFEQNALVNKALYCFWLLGGNRTIYIPSEASASPLEQF